MKKHRLVLILLSVTLIAGVVTGCGAANAGGAPSTPAAISDAFSPSASPADVSGRSIKNADSYADVFKALSAASKQNANWGRDFTTRGDSEEKGMSTAPSVSVPTADDGSNSAQGPDYSQTNVQVSGVDEGDIVKTDGNYIYVLRDNELIIFKADGASTSKVSSFKVVKDNELAVSSTPAVGSAEPNMTRYISEYASDIYVSGDTAVIVSSYASSGPYYDMKAGTEIDTGDAAKPDIAPSQDQQIAKLYMYDITDRSNPVKKAELGQDGHILSTRLIDSTLYMLSTYYVYSPDENDEGTYIPRLYDGGATTLISPDRIAIMPYFNATAYTVICAYDIDRAALAENQSILGGGTTVYMNKDTLFVASSTNNQTESAPYTESVYTVIDYTMTNITDIASFTIGSGRLELTASGSVPGSLSDQFALDAYAGSLRVVTTTYTQSWTAYTDKAKGFVNYVYKDPYSANALYVLDSSLKPVGSVEDLAKGEQVYSVRFDGDIGYFVTFRRVDPLFAVDLSDPANPTVLSALKIPGFSEYLHIWSDGRLFGLGMDADEETGRTNGMKLSMFDTTDPTDVTVKHTLKLNTSYSNALYNHKAILISADKSIIAFPADSGYDIYGYSDDRGFFKRASVSSIEWSGDSRGLYIKDFAYIVDYKSISVLDMNGFKLLNRISF